MTIHFYDDDRPDALHEHEGLTRYLTSITAKPPTLSIEDYTALPVRAQHAYNRQRIIYLSGGISINTPQLRDARLTVGQLISKNSGRNSGHHGIMFSGQSGLGKTTLCKAVMKSVFTSYKNQFPTFAEYGRIPVVYVEVPAGCTGKLLMAAFARFFGITIARADTMDTIRERVVETMNDARTQLVVVDELQNLGAANRGNGEAIDVLKALHNRVGATFVYAGINLRELPLFTGPRGQSLMARFGIIEMTKFVASDAHHQKDWKGIINQFEKCLPLADHTSGTLGALAGQLWELTRGSIGSLGRLITGAAIDLIENPLDRPEAITLDLLNKQELDTLAAEGYLRSLTVKGKTR